MVSIESLLQKATEDEQQAQKLVTVEKQLDLTYDLRHLAAFDSNPLDLERLRNNSERDGYISELTRDNCQLIINEIWTSLKTARVDNVITAVLPTLPVYNLPRAKPIPKPKPPTKWELFAKAKGIHKKKKERMVWDEVSQQWKPRYGYRSIGNQRNTNEWMIEVPDQAPDPNKDFFAEKIEQREERVAKNELQRLRNLSRSQKLKLPGTAGLLPNQTEQTNKKDDLVRAKYLLRQQSNASMGKFFNVDDNPGTGSKTEEKPRGIRRKFESNFEKDLSEEKRKNLDLVERVLREQKRPLDIADTTDKANKKLKRMNAKMRQVSKERKIADDEDEEMAGKKNRKTSRKQPAKNNKKLAGSKKLTGNTSKTNANASTKGSAKNRSLKKFQAKQKRKLKK